MTHLHRDGADVAVVHYESSWPSPSRHGGWPHHRCTRPTIVSGAVVYMFTLSIHVAMKVYTRRGTCIASVQMSPQYTMWAAGHLHPDTADGLTIAAHTLPQYLALLYTWLRRLITLQRRYALAVALPSRLHSGRPAIHYENTPRERHTHLLSIWTCCRHAYVAIEGYAADRQMLVACRASCLQSL